MFNYVGVWVVCDDNDVKTVDDVCDGNGVCAGMFVDCFIVSSMCIISYSVVGVDCKSNYVV